MKPILHKSIRNLFLIAFFLCLGIPNTSFASELTHVSDDADLFSDSEKEDLEAACTKVSKDNDIDVIILTVDGINVTRKQYIRNYYASMEDYPSDAVILLINMDANNRGIELQGYGNCEFTISNDRIETILDDMVPYLKDGLYYESMDEFLNDIDYFVNLEPTTNYQHTEEDNLTYDEDYYDNNLFDEEDYYDDEDYYDNEDYDATSNNSQTSPDESSFASKSLQNILIAVVISAIIVFFMAFNSGGRMTAGQGVYLDASHSRILGQYDHYIRTTTTRIPKPKPPKNNGGSGFSSGSFGGGGVSSGGHSHSGGGRSF